MIVELGNKFINLDKIWLAKTVTNDGAEEVHVWFDNSLPVIFRYNDAKKLLKILSADEVKPKRQRPEEDSHLRRIQLAFDKPPSMTIGDMIDAERKKNSRTDSG